MKPVDTLPVDSRKVESAPKRKRHRSPSDMRRDARRNAERQAEIRADRVEADARSQDVNEFMAGRLDRRQQGLDADKLRLRGEVRSGLGRSEADTYWGPGRG